MEHYDFIIAGGGCAGLSLAYQLIHSPLKDRSILIVDRDDKDQNDRTWAYWSESPTSLQSIVHKEWRQIRFIGASDGLIPTGSWRYVMIRGDDFYRHIRAELDEAPNVTWLKAPVKRIEDCDDGGIVWIDPDNRGPLPVSAYHGSWVFDSLFAIAEFHPDPASTLYLQQHFKGWFIETPEDAFDPSAATIFDFRTPQCGELRFFYVLPTSPRAALIEYVGLSLAEFDELLDGYIRTCLGISEYTRISDEIGITPLTDYAFSRQTGQHIMAVGIQGGLVKPSSGYAYTRIQEDSAAILRSLVENGHPFEVPGRPLLFRLLDSIMLQVMKDDPAAVAVAFTTMFQKNPAPRIFRFLDETASLRDLISLIISLPKLSFLRGAGRLAWRRVAARLRRGNDMADAAIPASA